MRKWLKTLDKVHNTSNLKPFGITINKYMLYFDSPQNSVQHKLICLGQVIILNETHLFQTKFGRHVPGVLFKTLRLTEPSLCFR